MYRLGMLMIPIQENTDVEFADDFFCIQDWQLEMQ